VYENDQGFSVNNKSSEYVNMDSSANYITMNNLGDGSNSNYQNLTSENNEVKNEFVYVKPFN